MRGRTPKPPAMRKGHHRGASTRATLPSVAKAAEQEVPPLPPRKGKWHERVVLWWERIWQSPMAAEYLEADKPGLEMLAVLHNAFWTARSNNDRFRYAAEIRQQEVRFGLTPIDRRRLQWEVERGDVASHRTETRRRRKRPDPKKDPRNVLRLEK